MHKERSLAQSVAQHPEVSEDAQLVRRVLVVTLQHSSAVLQDCCMDSALEKNQ